MGIRMLVRRILVVHAGKQRIVIEIFILVIQADVVAQLLASDALSPVVVIVIALVRAETFAVAPLR
jgi:hypothetical protein